MDPRRLAGRSTLATPGPTPAKGPDEGPPLWLALGLAVLALNALGGVIGLVAFIAVRTFQMLDALLPRP